MKSSFANPLTLGGFSGAAVQDALALGAGRIIALGRNEKALEKVASLSSRIATVQMTGEVESEVAALQKLGPIDAFFDISPPMAQGSTHIESVLLSMRAAGRASLMSGLVEDYALPIMAIMGNNLQIKGKFMYEREDIPTFMKLVDSGLLKLGKQGGNEVVATFGLADYEKGLRLRRRMGSSVRWC